LKITVNTIWPKASDSMAKYVWVNRTMKKPKRSAPSPATTGAAPIASSIEVPAFLTSSAAV